MFFDDSYGSQQNYEKKIKVYLNGDFLQKPVDVKLTRKMRDIRKAVTEAFNFQNIRTFRLFNEKGVELFEDDLEFLEAGATVYASKGADFDTNSCLSEYDLQKELGEGGFGKVWLGVHKETKEKVAIKILNTAHLSNAAEMDQIFREAEVMQTLSHDHIVQIKSCMTIGDSVVFILEYMEGGELLERVENAGKFSEEEAKIYFQQICSAMEYCHRNNLIHRDLKLENLLCTSPLEKICKVADFGIAGVASNSNSDNIDAGSLRYMAPEVLSGKLKQPSTAVDIWAMGVILYSMLVGDLPFKGKDNKEIIDRICEGVYEIPKDVQKTLSADCLDVLTKCLELDYTKRIKTATLLQHEWVKDKTLEKLMNKNMESQQQQDEEAKNEPQQEEEQKQEKQQSSQQQNNGRYQQNNNGTSKQSQPGASARNPRMQTKATAGSKTGLYQSKTPQTKYSSATSSSSYKAGSQTTKNSSYSNSSKTTAGQSKFNRNSGFSGRTQK